MQSQTGTGGRDLRIDFFRGLALLVMCIDHAEEMGNVQALSYFTYAPVGVSTAAEVFIFLSGLTLGIAYFPVYANRGFLLLYARCAVRAWQLFLLHVLALVATVAVITILPSLLGGDAASSDVSRSIATSNGMLARFVSLQANPRYFDILPLYIVLLLTTPVFFPLLGRSRVAGLIVAAGIHAVVQVAVLAGHFESLPFARSLYYNPLAWQLLFVTGIAIGVHRRLGEPLPRPSPRTFWSVVAVLALIALWYKGARVNALLGLFGDASYVAGEGVAYDVPLIDKPTLGPLRFAHFMLLAWVVSVWCPANARWLSAWWSHPLITCGRQALEVFVFGIAATYAAGVTMDVIGGGRPLMLLLDALAVSASVAVAYAVAWRKSEPWRGASP